MAVYNSTFSANTADRFGGAVNHGSSNDLVINSCTFYLNAANHPDYPGGGGIYVSAGKTLHLSNSILANSLNGGDCTNDGNLGTHKGNLIKDGSCSPAIPADPKLGPLQDNGGPTETHALLGGSPAIDAGEGAYCPALDQRGIARDGKCDIGAYEYQGLSDFLFIPLARKD